jgi:transposase
MAARYGIGKDTVARIWQARQIRPWKVATFELSTDPAFESKLRDVVGLYVNPPAAAAVFCFDEKTQVQALDRTQPSVPMVPGRAGIVTHDDKRTSTVDPVRRAEPRLREGAARHPPLRHRPRRAGVLPLDRQARRPRPGAARHLGQPLGPHAQACPDWLAHEKRRRWQLHFTPTSSSWLDLVEYWLSVLSRKASTNTSLSSVAELESRIDCWVSHWNDNPEPFVWPKRADH